MVKIRDVTIDQDSLFYGVVMFILLSSIVFCIWAFTTSALDGNFRKKLPGESCNPHKTQECGDGLVCDLYTPEKSHPLLRPPPTWDTPFMKLLYPNYVPAPKDIYMCQIPEDLRMNRTDCQAHCDDCPPVVEEEIMINENYYRNLFIMLLIIIGVILIVFTIYGMIRLI